MSVLDVESTIDLQALEAITPAAWRALRRDIRTGAVILQDRPAQWVLGIYYDLQGFRVGAGNRSHAAGAMGLPAEFMNLLRGDLLKIETNLKGVLEAYASSTPWGRWALGIPGFGPVIAAGLSAFVDPERFPTPAKVWRFFGMDPTVSWGPGQKRPWSARAKVLAYHIGELVVRVRNSPYRPLYEERKRYEWQRNLSGDLADQARARLQRGVGDVQRNWYAGRVDPDWVREALERGLPMTEPRLLQEGEGIPMLPPGHIHARARRWVAKLVLAHFWEVRYWYLHGQRPPQPWVIAHGGHVEYIPPPNCPW